jgi:hypothetical protein
MRRSFLFAVCLVAGAARADAPKGEASPAQQRAVQKYGLDHPDCLEWTDGCMICTPITCSTPGPACTPGEPFCTARVENPADPAPVAPPSQKP